MEKIKEFFNKLNTLGIPIPLFRDPKTGVGSISFTLVVISAINVQFGLINLFANFVKGVDIMNAIYWFGICSGLYFGRTITYEKGKSEINKE